MLFLAIRLLGPTERGQMKNVWVLYWSVHSLDDEGKTHSVYRYY